MIGRQSKYRQRAAELFSPVIKLLFEHISLQPLALPDRVVGILDWQQRQLQFLSLREDRVIGHKFVDQHIQGLGVSNDVVHRRKQDVLLV